MSILARAWQWVAGLGAAALGLAALAGDDEEKPPVVPPGPAPGPLPWVGPAVAGLPQGKGIFTRALKHGGGPSLFAERMQYLGMRWVLVQSMFHDSNGRHIGSQSQHEAYAAELEAVGCTPWVWGWPRPESAQQFIDVSMSAIEKLGAPGLLINVEQAYRGPRAADDARRLMELARDALGDRPLGITTYGGGPGYIASFPWDVFASADFVVPQFYDSKRSLGPNYPRQATARYIAAGYRNIIPAWAASNRFDPDWMQTMADRTPLPAGAVCWWDLYWLLLSKQRVEWVRNYRVPAPRGDAIA